MMNSEISSNTISIYELIENHFDFQMTNYAIFDESYRSTLNNAILNYYMFREIGYSNPAVFRQRLNMRLDIIMRNKYNALYKAKLMEFNPLYTMELYETYTHNIKNKGEMTNNSKASTKANADEVSNTKSNNSSDTSNNGLNVSSQFPNDEMTEGDLTDNIFVDNAQKQNGTEHVQGTDTNNTNSNSTSKQDSTALQNALNKNNMEESYSKKTIGSASDLTFAHAMTQFKDYVDKFNIDQQVIDELKDLFMTCW